MRNMKKLYLLTMLICVLCSLGLHAQVTTDPTPLQEDSQNIVIYFHADQGNKGLMGLTANTKIFAHTGVITNKSTSNSDWKYTIADWNKDTEKAQLTYEGPNLWKLYIGDIRTYYGITDMSETVKQLAFVFRTSGGTKEGKTASGGDIFVDVVDPGLQVSLSSTLEGQIIDSKTGTITFTANSTSNANLTITVNGQLIGSQNNVSTLTANYTFNQVGDYTIIAQATNGSETAVDELNLAYFSNPQSRSYPGGTPVMGPVTNPDGSVTFCVAAPEMDRMVIVGSWNDYLITNAQQMYYTDYVTTQPVTGESGTFRYFWITIPELGTSDQQYIYFFKVQGTISASNNTMTVNTTTCDPYARLVLDPWNDKYIDTNVYPNLPEYPYQVTNEVPVAVYQRNINDYDWQCTDFVAPDQDNLIIYEMLLRDFTGTEGKADGNGTVRQAIEKIPYLVELGVNAVELLPIYDFSGNLSWGYNPNFYFAPDKAYGTPSDYKEFIDLCHQNGIAVILDMVFNQSDGLHPWYQMYGGTQYSPFYNARAPHDYSVLNDWKQDYPLVQIQWRDALIYWTTEYKFDGYRFDLVKGLGLNGSYGSGTEAYNQSRVNEMKYLNSVIKEYNKNGYCINENLASAQEENAMAADGQLNWLNMNDPACEYAMGWPTNSSLNALYAPNASRTKWSTISYLESHDEQRLAYKQDQWGVENYIEGNVQNSMQRLGSTAAQMLMTPGSHMIWQFSEMGNAQNTKNQDGSNNTDNKIVNWNLLNEPNHYGLFQSYSEMNFLRLHNPEFFGTNATFTMNCSNTNWGASGGTARTLISTVNGKELITVINPNYSGGAITYNYNFANKNNSDYQILSKSYNSSPSYNAASGTISVQPNCYVVIGSSTLAGVDDILAEDASQALQVYGDKGRIVVDYAAKGATVYSLDGKVIGSVAESGEVAVASGLYIVKSGNKSVKIVVR